MKNFIAECHRRSVFRVAAIYIVGAWVVLQVADLAFDAWGIPPTALRFVWLAALFGMPAALMFGWRYDVIGGSIVATPSSDDTPATPLQRIDYLVLSAMGLAVASMILSLGAEIGSVRPVGDTTVADSRDTRAIAVLPFKDASTGESESTILANGIQDDLLTRLSKIGSLKVISRTSVERYRNTDASILDIGRELGVGRILEGGIQRAGDRLRINVQLIDATSDEHIWAETYERTLSANNIFDVQSEIVAKIGEQLHATLTPLESQRISVMPTQNIAAYTIYLKANASAGIESVESTTAAITGFNQAIDLDPEFALAYVGLANAYLTLGEKFYGGIPIDEGVLFAEPLALKALELDPDLGTAHAVIGLVRRHQNDFDAAEESYRRAIELQPNDSRVYQLYGSLRWLQGRRDEAMGYFEKALEIDPYSVPVNFQYARALDGSARFDDALALYMRVVEEEPDHAFACVYIAAIQFMVYGRIDEALVWYQKAALSDPQSPSLQSAQVVTYLEIGDTIAAKHWVDRSIDLGPRTFWAVWASLVLNLYSGDEVAAQKDARLMLEIFPENWGAHKLLRNVDIAAGRYEVARARYARSFRELVEPEIPDVNRGNLVVAIDLALVLQKLGDHERAKDLLDGALTVIESMPRLGTDGFWIADVHVYSLQNRPDKALDALAQAIDEGWRFLTWYNLEFDPNLDAIKGDPRFEELYARLRADIEEQSRRVDDLKASGELIPIAQRFSTTNEDFVVAPLTRRDSCCDHEGFGSANQVEIKV